MKEMDGVKKEVKQIIMFLLIVIVITFILLGIFSYSIPAILFDFIATLLFFGTLGLLARLIFKERW